jgi:hypothetical protein
VRRLPLVLAAVGLALVSVPTPADAAALEQQGWWYRLRPAGLPTDLPARQDVGEGQLLVEGAPEGPLAIAAVRFRLDDGETNPVLTVPVAQHVGTPETTVVVACAADVAWNPAEGGAWDDRPFPDCSTSVDGSPSADGSSWSFPVTALEERGVVDVVLLPGKVPNGADPVSGSTFRLVLGAPALTTTPGIEAPSALAPAGPSGPAGAPGSGSAPVLAPPVAPGGSFTPPAAGTPASPGTPAVPQATTPTTALGASVPPVPASTTPDERSRAIGFVILALAAAAAFATDRLPALSPGAEQVGGLGRFARPRTDPPPSLL